MNVYEYAMKVEKDGEAYYNHLASKAPNNGLKKVFHILAEAEVSHYNVFKSMRDKDGSDYKAIDISTDTKTIFETLNKQKDSVTFDAEQIKFYEDAIKREEDSYQFYIDKAQELENEDEKTAFINIAKEEVKHKAILEEIIHFIQEPDNWVASAEF
jgi:rubrerythrin